MKYFILVLLFVVNLSIQAQAPEVNDPIVTRSPASFAALFD